MTTSSRPVPKSVPHIALYGDAVQPSWLDLVHFERIPERSSLFDWEIEPHVHDALIQVLYARSGGGEAFIDGVKWTLQPPCLIVAPARSVHGFSFHDDIDGPVVTAAQRPLETVAEAAAPELLATIRRPAVLRVEPGSRYEDALMPLFEAIEREARTYATGQAAAGMSLLVALFVQIGRIGETQPGEEAARSRKSAQIERLRSLLDAGFRTQRSVAWYAGEIGVTSGQLTRLCREVLGMSTLEVIHARVLHEAQRELVYSSLSVKQIAADLGFEDEAYFGRLFRKQTGSTPSAFRAMARGRLAG